jgi:hypothetical protein
MNNILQNPQDSVAPSKLTGDADAEKGGRVV